METPGYTPQPPVAEPKNNSRTIIIVVVVLLVLCCCCVIFSGLGYWLWNNGDQMFGTGALLNKLAAL